MRELIKKLLQLFLSFILIFNTLILNTVYADIKTIHLDQDNPSASINTDCGGGNLKITVQGGKEATSQILFDVKQENMANLDEVTIANLKGSSGSVNDSLSDAAKFDDMIKIQYKNTYEDCYIPVYVVGGEHYSMSFNVKSLTDEEAIINLHMFWYSDLVPSEESFLGIDWSGVNQKGLGKRNYTTSAPKGAKLGLLTITNATSTMMEAVINDIMFIQGVSLPSEYMKVYYENLQSGQELILNKKMILHSDGMLECNVGEPSAYEMFLGKLSLGGGVNHVTVICEGDFTAIVEYNDSMEYIIDQLAKENKSQSLMIDELLSLINNIGIKTDVSFQYDENGNLEVIELE